MSPPSKRWDEALPLGEPCAASSQADLLSSIATNTAAASQADGICSICRIDQLPSGLEEPKSDPITGQLHGTFERVEEALHRRIVVTVARPAHRALDAVMGRPPA